MYRNPCYWCRNELISIISNIEGIQCACVNCDAKGPRKDTDKEAVEAWNDIKIEGNK